VLGFLEAFDFVEQTHVMSIGDALYMDTDGIPEATDHKGGLFSVERLQELLQRNARQPVGEILSETISAVQKFVGGAPQSDDLTLLAFRYLKAAVRP